ncbi:hypothetical protein [Hymenobacter qilianensis]|uniref:hypothetical protein n=1 Tax=Hymenobacter qilianensis TaxID=1385715 RepID=UPI001CB9513C|nr:hypothetical protein [Hymenobacter qilianensis]
MLQPRLLFYVAWPVLRFRPVTPPQLPDTWQDGNYLVRLYLGGWLPLGTQWMVISQDATRFWLRDNGHGPLARGWDHHITLRPTGAGQTWYTDEVTIHAGLLTPLVTGFAAGFYWWRQRRWVRLVRRGFAF